MLRCIDWHGLQAVEFGKGDYEALLIPGFGANLVRLANVRLGVEILRTPAADEIETFKGRPHVFGLPVLFPPNRIADGTFTFGGRTYHLPITQVKEHHYHHGILKSQPFAVSKAWETDEEVFLECRYYSNAGNDAIFRDFPHEFKCKISFRLTADGLEQEVFFANRSRETMPIGVGFHTPMRIPFADGGAEDYVLRMAVGEQVELNGRNIPTGRTFALPENFARLRSEGLRVTECDPIEAAFTVREIDVDGRPSAECWSRTSGRGYGPSTKPTNRPSTGRSGTTAGMYPTAAPSRSRGGPMPPTPLIRPNMASGPSNPAASGGCASVCGPGSRCEPVW